MLRIHVSKTTAFYPLKRGDLRPKFFGHTLHPKIEILLIYCTPILGISEIFLVIIAINIHLCDLWTIH